MTAPTATASRIEDERLLAILRLPTVDLSVGAVGALVRGGVSVLELSLASPASLEAIGSLAATLPEHVLLGAGTVTSVDQARAAVDAGARFLIAPNIDLDVLAWARRHKVLYVPGVLTPTEVAAAWAAGCRLLKLFPAGRLGPGYVRDLLGPFPSLRLVPTGGVDAENAGAYLAAGAVAVAVGGALISEAAAQDIEALVRAARSLRERISRCGDADAVDPLSAGPPAPELPGAHGSPARDGA